MYTTSFYISAYIGIVGADWIDDSMVAAEYDAHLVNGPSSKLNGKMCTLHFCAIVQLVQSVHSHTRHRYDIGIP